MVKPSQPRQDLREVVPAGVVVIAAAIKESAEC